MFDVCASTSLSRSIPLQSTTPFTHSMQMTPHRNRLKKGEKKSKYLVTSGNGAGNERGVVDRGRSESVGQWCPT